jgi:hypothetical protein
MPTLRQVLRTSVCSLFLTGILGHAGSALGQDRPGGGANQAPPSIKDRKFGFAPWSPGDINKRRAEFGLVGPGSSKPYPKPTFPRRLAKPNSIEELMPNARAAVRQTGGRTSLGLTDPGDTVLIVTTFDSEPMVQEAIIKAFQERGIKATILYQHDVLGVPKDDLAAIKKAENVFDATDAQQEFREWFFRGIYDVDKARAWFKQQDAELYAVTFPEITYPEPRLQELSRVKSANEASNLIKYLDEHPQINKVFWGQGGRPRHRLALKHHGEKFISNYTYVNFFDIMSDVPSFPSDVWRLVETKTIEPLAYVDRVEVSDPEGTVLAFDVTPEVAETWSKGVYLQGHLYLFPAQASGIWPYSVVNYPALESTYLEPFHVRANGVVAATNDHVSTHPRMELAIREGQLTEVRGGGYYGDLMRIAQKYPGINDVEYPEYKKGEPGFWWLWEGAIGTNPKYFKHPAELLAGGNLSERNVAGAIHWSFGSFAQHGPEKIGDMSPNRVELGKQTNIPIDHCCHNHTLMTTYQVRVRGLDQWVSLVEHGRLTAMDDRYVRALASRYGNPDKILSQAHVPPIPGVNAPGNYNDYARNPGQYWIDWSNQIVAGTSAYLSD